MAFGFSFSHKTKDINNAWKGLGTTGTNTFNSGTGITDEGLGDLRSLGSEYADRLKNPLGTGPNSASGIFARARGNLSDVATRATNSFGSRIFQQARQNGGYLSPEQQAELNAQNALNVNQGLFEGNNAISDSEAAMTLTETSKLFDRMEGIAKTILGVGQGRETLGLQTLIASLSGRQNLALGKAAAAAQAVGVATGVASVGVSGSGGGGSTSGITGKP